MADQKNGLHIFGNNGESRKTRERRLQAAFEICMSNLTILLQDPNEQIDTIAKAAAHLIVSYEVDADKFLEAVAGYDGLIREALKKTPPSEPEAN